MFTENLPCQYKNSISIDILPNVCEVYCRSIYDPIMVELINNDPTLTLHKGFLGFNMTYINFTDYWLIQSK